MSIKTLSVGSIRQAINVAKRLLRTRPTRKQHFLKGEQAPLSTCLVRFSGRCCLAQPFTVGWDGNFFSMFPASCRFQSAELIETAVLPLIPLKFSPIYLHCKNSKKTP
ncbi:MAG: hypothetical protein AAF614_34105 [Chloroflexota bacterium]